MPGTKKAAKASARAHTHGQTQKRVSERKKGRCYIYERCSAAVAAVAAVALVAALLSVILHFELFFLETNNSCHSSVVAKILIEMSTSHCCNDFFLS